MRMQSLTAALITLSLAWPLQAVAHGEGNHEEAGLTPEARQQLAALRAATAIYHDFGAASTLWTIPVPFPPAQPECMVDTDGEYDGAMGYHFIRGEYVGGPGMLDATRPQALIYEPERDGSMRLVAVEFITLGAETDPPPVLFGQPFEWNSRFQVWTLHVWTWRHNPNGLFAAWNPMVSCDHAFL